MKKVKSIHAGLIAAVLLPAFQRVLQPSQLIVILFIGLPTIQPLSIFSIALSASSALDQNGATDPSVNVSLL